MSDVIIGMLCLSGGFFAVIAALGLVRLPDVLVRMHASTKAGTLACGLIVAGAMVFFGDISVLFRGVVIVAFLLLTAPVAAHMIGRAAMRTGAPLRQINPDDVVERLDDPVMPNADTDPRQP